MMKTIFKRNAHSGVAHIGLQILLTTTVLLLAACASPPPAPTEQLAVSKATVDQAVSAGAPEFAPAELSSARDKLDRANVAMAAKDYTRARVLAEQAQVDAQLAVTKSRSSIAQRAAAAVQEDSRVLREEINRKAK